LDGHTIGHPAYKMTYPDRDLAVDESSIAISFTQLPEKSASQKHLKELLFGRQMIPLSCVAMRYRPINFIALVCSTLGFSENLAH
jgi:hypothetical protein